MATIEHNGAKAVLVKECGKRAYWRAYRANGVCVGFLCWAPRPEFAVREMLDEVCKP